MALKDNIDLAGVPTTAGDPRNTVPAAQNAFVVDRLIAAGAVPLGKTNLDQYATGLVGTRSPYGACHSVFSADHVSGGSSSGSAVAVASGQVDFALGTDTAGSGRVPAAFNRIVGIKPSRGLVSARGVVPACRSLDCVTVMARSVSTARRAFDVMVAFDPDDAWSRRASDLPRIAAGRSPGADAVIGVPDLDLDLDPQHEAGVAADARSGDRLGDVVKVDVRPLLEAAELLYSGPWLAERWLAFGDKLVDNPAVDPTVRAIVDNGANLTAADAFAGFDRLATLARASEHLWTQLDALLLPVTAGHPTLAEVAADPIGVNSRLGRFTNMVNLLDLCAIAFPGPDRSDGSAVRCPTAGTGRSRPGADRSRRSVVWRSSGRGGSARGRRRSSVRPTPQRRAGTTWCPARLRRADRFVVPDVSARRTEAGFDPDADRRRRAGDRRRGVESARGRTRWVRGDGRAAAGDRPARAVGRTADPRVRVYGGRGGSRAGHHVVRRLALVPGREVHLGFVFMTPAEQSVLDRIDEELLVRVTCELLQATGQNPPGEEAATVAVLAAAGRELGLDVVTSPVEPGRDNVSITLAGGNGPGLLILGHSDVVPVGDGWTTDPYGGLVKDGRIYGRGASDMKGGLAAALIAMAALRGAG